MNRNFQRKSYFVPPEAQRAINNLLEYKGKLDFLLLGGNKRNTILFNGNETLKVFVKNWNVKCALTTKMKILDP